MFALKWVVLICSYFNYVKTARQQTSYGLQPMNLFASIPVLNRTSQR